MKKNCKVCKSCGSNNLKKIHAENMSDVHLDNIIETFKCNVCGHKQTETIHIG